MKKQFLRILLLLVMVLSLVPGMSIAASAEEAEEMSEVLAFEKGSAEVESPHFILSAGQSEYYGWFVDSGTTRSSLMQRNRILLSRPSKRLSVGTERIIPILFTAAAKKLKPAQLRTVLPFM